MLYSSRSRPTTALPAPYQRPTTSAPCGLQSYSPPEHQRPAASFGCWRSTLARQTAKPAPPDSWQLFSTWPPKRKPGLAQPMATAASSVQDARGLALWILRDGPPSLFVSKNKSSWVRHPSVSSKPRGESEVSLPKPCS